MLFFYFCKYLVGAILKPFLDFRGILVIFWILEVFWSFFGFQEYFGYFLDFGDILVIFRFRGILVIFWVLVVVRSQILAQTQIETGDGPNKPSTINL